jgi:hypothetical protein
MSNFDDVEWIDRHLQQLEMNKFATMDPDQQIAFLQKRKDKLMQEKQDTERVRAISKTLQQIAQTMSKDDERYGEKMKEIQAQIALDNIINLVRLSHSSIRMGLEMFYADKPVEDTEAQKARSDICNSFQIVANRFIMIDRYMSSMAKIMLEAPESPYGKVMQAHFEGKFDEHTAGWVKEKEEKEQEENREKNEFSSND